MQRTMRSRENSEARMNKNIGTIAEKEKNYILNLIDGGRERIFCTPETLRSRIRDKSQKAVGYISY